MQGKLLDGKVALVTGGMKGIGLAISEDLAAHGAHVAACGRSMNAVDEFTATVEQGMVTIDPLPCNRHWKDTYR